jgi:hypothetical protein
LIKTHSYQGVLTDEAATGIGPIAHVRMLNASSVHRFPDCSNAQNRCTQSLKRWRETLLTAKRERSLIHLPLGDRACGCNSRNTNKQLFFFVFNRRLYVCSSPKAGKAFYSDPDSNIKKADANWQFYQPPSNPGFRRELGS